jgi:hypothetical protein
MTLTPQEEYEAALVQYRAAQARLVEAKRHYDHKTAPEVIAARRAKSAEYRAKKRAERNTPEAKAERERRRQEYERWLQRMANEGQRAIERSENMPDVLRILTRVGGRS